MIIGIWWVGFCKEKWKKIFCGDIENFVIVYCCILV